MKLTDPGKPLTDAEKSAKFRQDASRIYLIVVIVLAVVAIGLVALGWWIGHWWGLGIGIVLAVLLLAGGLTAATMLYAMTQDGA